MVSHNRLYYAMQGSIAIEKTLKKGKNTGNPGVKSKTILCQILNPSV
jgi:hypothetical protein